MDEKELRQAVKASVEAFYRAVHEPRPAFVPGKTPVPVSGRVFDAEDMTYLTDAMLDFWLTGGRFSTDFEKGLSDYLGVRHTLSCNSGSSANLLSLACLTSPKLGERQLKPFDEVITLASGFPTTVNPIVQLGLTPVFVDVHVPTYNVDVRELEAAVGPKTKAVFLPHTLGNPFDIDSVVDVCRRYDLWLLEDACDALGAEYTPANDAIPLRNSEQVALRVGSFGHLSSFSFYPAHHITTGEGGAVATGSEQLKKITNSFRDWGRDCWCGTGRNNTCAKRFDFRWGDLPHGYDHKYVYSHIGYNLKMTDLQAAVGVAQLKKLPRFVETRNRNFQTLYDGLGDLQAFFLLPESEKKARPSWFGFPLAVRQDAPFSRNDVIRFLDERKIDTRLLFGGNLTKQPAYKDVPYRKIDELPRSDFVMNKVFWIGVYPGLTGAMLEFVINTLHDFVRRY
jgi:CDP-6-deoxy-D-xylo-4-hexulose-3-dehydrase